MSDPESLTRFRCPQCRSRQMIDIATATIPYLCPTCHVELEPLGKKVDPSAITKEISSFVPKSPAAAAASASTTTTPPAELSEIDYLRKIHFWVRLAALLSGGALVAALCAALR